MVLKYKSPNNAALLWSTLAAAVLLMILANGHIRAQHPTLMTISGALIFLGLGIQIWARWFKR